MNINAQHDFGTYINKLFFNAYSSSPDPSVYKFLNDFAPILLNPPQNSGHWTIYSSQNIITPVVIIHSLIFNKHPFIDAPIAEGEFKIYTNVFNDTVYDNITGIKNIQVILEFEKFEDASKLFENLRRDLKKLAEEITYYEDESRKFFDVASHENLYSIPSGVRILLETKRGVNNLFHLYIN